MWALERLQLIIPHKQNHFIRNEREAPQSLLTRWDLVEGQTANWWIRKRHNSIRILLATTRVSQMARPRGRIEEEKCVVSVIVEIGLDDKSLVNECLTGKGRD